MHELPIILAKKDLYDEGSIDPVHQAKARVLNRALQEIGMGRYQVRNPADFPWRLYQFKFSVVCSLLRVSGVSRECMIINLGMTIANPLTSWQRQRQAGKLHGLEGIYAV